jgi:hypothetical protein
MLNNEPTRTFARHNKKYRPKASRSSYTKRLRTAQKTYGTTSYDSPRTSDATLTPQTYANKGHNSTSSEVYTTSEIILSYHRCNHPYINTDSRKQAIFIFYPLNFMYLSTRSNIPKLIVNIVGISACSQQLLTCFIRRPDDGHVRTETCSLIHNKIWCVWRQRFIILILNFNTSRCLQ